MNDEILYEHLQIAHKCLFSLFSDFYFQLYSENEFDMLHFH